MFLIFLEDSISLCATLEDNFKSSTKGNAIRQLLSLQLISSLIIWVQAGRQEPAEVPTLPRWWNSELWNELSSVPGNYRGHVMRFAWPHPVNIIAMIASLYSTPCPCSPVVSLHQGELKEGRNRFCAERTTEARTAVLCLLLLIEFGMVSLEINEREL